MPKIFIHPLFHTSAGFDSEVDLASESTASIGEVLRTVCGENRQMLFKMMDEQGELRPHVAVFVGDEHCKFLGGVNAKVEPGDEVSVFPALSGG